MKQTDQTLLEQMRITEFEVEQRKALFSFSQNDVHTLISYKHPIEENIDELVEEFYRMQTSNAEIALLIGDADTLSRLRNAQRRYIIDLFSGVYDLEYHKQYTFAPQSAFTVHLTHVICQLVS